MGFKHYTELKFYDVVKAVPRLNKMGYDTSSLESIALSIVDYKKKNIHDGYPEYIGEQTLATLNTRR